MMRFSASGPLFCGKNQARLNDAYKDSVCLPNNRLTELHAAFALIGYA
jgi:hypothetical protein